MVRQTDKQPERVVEVEVAASFKLGDRFTRIGDRVSLPVSHALDLIAMGFAFKPVPYRNRATRSEDVI